MNGSEILNRIRNRFLDDPLSAGSDDNALFLDEDIFEAIDEAQKRFAIDTRMLRDSRTSSVTEYTITADDEWVEISDKVIEIKKASLNSSGARLSIIDHQRLDNGYLNIDDYFNFTSTAIWETDTGTPQAIILNLDHEAVRLYPIPESSDQLNLTVIRLPLTEVNEANKLTDLEFSDLWKSAMTYGALSELYMKQDSDEAEGVDMSRAGHFDALYEREVTKAVRQRERSQQSTQSNKTRYGGIP